jgi:hypothetical protein
VGASKTSEPIDGVLSEVEVILTAFDRHTAALAATHKTIPALLAEEYRLSRDVGADVAGKLAAVASKREAESRRRAAAVDGVLAAEAVLAGVAGVVAQRQRELAATVVTEFSIRWHAACSVLDTLRAEAAALAAALACAVPTPPPFQIVHSVAHDRPEIHPRPLAPADPVTVALPPELVKVKAVADRLNKATTLCFGVRKCREWDSRHHALALQRGLPLEHHGVYVVHIPFNCPLDGLEFQAGMLVDATVMSNGFLSRMLLTQRLQPVEIAAGVAA